MTKFLKNTGYCRRIGIRTVTVTVHNKKITQIETAEKNGLMICGYFKKEGSV
jgi:hypothetical protein